MGVFPFEDVSSLNLGHPVHRMGWFFISREV